MTRYEQDEASILPDPTSLKCDWITVRQKSYLFQTGEDRAVDPRDVPCLSKYINHSCKPNCLAEVWSVRSRERFRLVAAQEIRIDDPLEISYDISPTRGGNCLCRSENCQYRPIRNEVNTAPKIQILQGLRDNEVEEDTAPRKQTSQGLRDNEEEEDTAPRTQTLQAFQGLRDHGEEGKLAPRTGKEDPDSRQLGCHERTFHPSSTSLSTPLDRLRQFKLYAKLSKYAFLIQSVKFLSYIISSKSIAIDASRVKSIRT